MVEEVIAGADIQTLPGALAAEIKRVTELRELYRQTQDICGPQANMKPAVLMMTMALDAAVEAAGNADIVVQMRALAHLKGFTD